MADWAGFSDRSTLGHQAPPDLAPLLDERWRSTSRRPCTWNAAAFWLQLPPDRRPRAAFQFPNGSLPSNEGLGLSEELARLAMAQHFCAAVRSTRLRGRAVTRTGSQGRLCSRTAA